MIYIRIPSKGSLRSAKRMNFWKISERPLTPAPFSENILQFSAHRTKPHQNRNEIFQIEPLRKFSENSSVLPSGGFP